VKLSTARLGGLALVGALALTACGSDNNSGSSASTTTGGAGATSAAAVSGTINGEGSTAQKNAIDEAISDFTGQNPNAKVNYNATGSGATGGRARAGATVVVGATGGQCQGPHQGEATRAGGPGELH